MDHMLKRFQQRSERLEHIDIGDYTAEEYESCIKELQLVNEWMGDARALRLSLWKAIETSNLETVSVLDVGAGSVCHDQLRSSSARFHPARLAAAS